MSHRILPALQLSRSLTGLATAVLCSFAMSFAIAMPAAAAYLAVPTVGSDTPGGVTVQLEGHTVSIGVESHRIAVRDDTYSISFSMDLDFEVVRFDDGPVMLSNMVFAGATNNRGLTVIVGPDGVYDANTAAGQLVTEIRTLRPAGRSGTDSIVGVSFDWTTPGTTPTSPIPEPSAALLFASGLLVVGGATRSTRR